MSIPRRLCADTIRDFAREASGNDSTRQWLLACAEAYIRGEGLVDIGQPATTPRASLHGPDGHT